MSYSGITPLAGNVISVEYQADRITPRMWGYVPDKIGIVDLNEERYGAINHHWLERDYLQDGDDPATDPSA